jgi:hypothetical protein
LGQCLHFSPNKLFYIAVNEVYDFFDPFLLLFLLVHFLVDKVLLQVFQAIDDVLVYFLELFAVHCELLDDLLEFKLLFAFDFEQLLELDDFQSIISRLSHWQLFSGRRIKN